MSSDDLNPKDVPDDEDPFSGGAGPAGDGMEPESDTPGWLRALRSTDPPASPETVEGNFSLDADPSDHLECAFVKISGSDGLEAWMHLVAAGLLVVYDRQEGGEEAPEPAGGEVAGDAETRQAAADTGGSGFTAAEVDPDTYR